MSYANKCCGKHLQNSFRYCPHCAKPNVLWEGIKRPNVYPVNDLTMRERELNLVAVRTGEFRPPKKGEFYLSGAKPVAYRAPNDLSTSFWIMEVIPRSALTTAHIASR